jgi:hypothetical protein
MPRHIHLIVSVTYRNERTDEQPVGLGSEMSVHALGGMSPLGTTVYKLLQCGTRPPFGDCLREPWYHEPPPRVLKTGFRVLTERPKQESLSIVRGYTPE